VGDTVALLMADRAFPLGSVAGLAKMGVLIGSTIAALLGTLILVTGSRAAARSPAPD
jgi:NhaA family Na+:H+ antiporter